MSRRLGEVWPVVAQRVNAALAGRGIDPATRDDIAQETFLRALNASVTFTSGEDLAPWAIRVAHNLVTSQWRKDRRLFGEPSLDLVDRSADVAMRATLRQDEVGPTWAALRRLPWLDQEALLMPLAGRSGGDDREVNYWAVRRLRARAKLRDVLSLPGVVLGRLRWRWRWLDELLSRPVATAMGVALCGVLAVVGQYERGPAPVGPRPVAKPGSERAAPADAYGGRSGVLPARQSSAAGHGGGGTGKALLGAAGAGQGRTPDVAVGAGDKHFVDAFVEPGGTDESLLCVSNVPTPGKQCFGQPARQWARSLLPPPPG
jgi:hypothetical protein